MAAQRLTLELPNQSMAPGVPAVPIKLLMKPSFRAYINCQMMPISGRDNITGTKKMLW